MTYWPGMGPQHCNSTGHDLLATRNLGEKTAKKMVIKPRNAFIYEACYWKISAEKGQYQETAQIAIYINRTHNGEFWIYEGSDRHDVKFVVPNNASAVARDTPYLVPVNSGAIVVFMTKSPQKKPKDCIGCWAYSDTHRKGGQTVPEQSRVRQQLGFYENEDISRRRFKIAEHSGT